MIMQYNELSYMYTQQFLVIFSNESPLSIEFLIASNEKNEQLLQ